MAKNLSYAELSAYKLAETCEKCLKSIAEARIQEYEEYIASLMEPREVGFIFKVKVCRTRDEAVKAADRWKLRQIKFWNFQDQEETASRLLAIAKVSETGVVNVTASDFSAISTYW